MSSRRSVLLLVLAITLILLAAWEPALAQCSMCKQSITGATNSESLVKGLNLAVLVLLLPPVAIFATIFGAVYRYRNSQDEKYDLPQE